ncbi:hypothetical protein NL108_018374 [Boleophthalmus pectinirostris]|nr:hypothetical protein NL108_018374 [Boleophthalmus pectinirostris]
MEQYHNVVGQLVQYFQQRINLYVVVILAFSYRFLFEKDLPCTCGNPVQDCILYMLLPFLIILMAQLWMDRACQRSCVGCSCSCCCFIFSRLCTAFFVSGIWPVSVLIDGDWSVCCFNEVVHKISCKNERERTDKEQDILRDIQDFSRVIGLSVLLGLFFLAFLASCIHNICECAQRGDWREVVLEEEEKVLSDELRKKAKEKLQRKLDKHMDREEWAKCFSVGKEVIIEMETPASVQKQPQNTSQHLF